MKNIVNIVIIGLLVIVLIISGSLYLNHKENENNRYNEDIIEVVMKTINGKYDIDKIDSLNCEDWLKDSLKEYYNDNFYSTDDLILLYEDFKDIDIILDELNKDIELCTVDGIFNSSNFTDIVISKFYENSVSELNGIPLYKYLEIYETFISNNYIYENKTDDYIVLKDNNLYVPITKLDNYTNQISGYYKGILFTVSVNVLEKRILTNYMEELVVSTTFVEDDYEFYVVRDSANNSYDFKVKKKFGKIISVEF